MTKSNSLGVYVSTMKENVLVAIDQSDPAWEALREACAWLNTDDLTVLHILDTGESSYGIEGGAADAWHAAKQAGADDLFERAEQIAAEYDVNIETAVEYGRPADAIIRYASEHDIDHIILGSHGRSGLSRMLLGSVAEEVVRNSPVSVTIARQTKEESTPD